MKGRGKREIPEKTRRPTASSGTNPTCGNPERPARGSNPDRLGFYANIIGVASDANIGWHGNHCTGPSGSCTQYLTDGMAITALDRVGLLTVPAAACICVSDNRVPVRYAAVENNVSLNEFAHVIRNLGVEYVFTVQRSWLTAMMNPTARRGNTFKDITVTKCKGEVNRQHPEKTHRQAVTSGKFPSLRDADRFALRQQDVGPIVPIDPELSDAVCKTRSHSSAAIAMPSGTGEIRRHAAASFCESPQPSWFTFRLTYTHSFALSRGDWGKGSDKALQHVTLWLLNGFITTRAQKQNRNTSSGDIALRSDLKSTQKTVSLFDFRAGLEIEMKFISIRDQQPSSTNVDESEIRNHEISLVQHFYIGTKIKLDAGSEVGSFDLGSGKMLVQPGITIRKLRRHEATLKSAKLGQLTEALQESSGVGGTSGGWFTEYGGTVSYPASSTLARQENGSSTRRNSDFRLHHTCEIISSRSSTLLTLQANSQAKFCTTLLPSQECILLSSSFFVQDKMNRSDADVRNHSDHNYSSPQQLHLRSSLHPTTVEHLAWSSSTSAELQTLRKGGATMVYWLGYLFPIKANRVRFRAGSLPDFRIKANQSPPSWIFGIFAGIVPGCSAGFFLGISRFARHYIPALLHSHPPSPFSAL
ncbi:hypothetical protein PR048_027131 [Dryococelus australis]|uniref:Uncharacterized protein n=1 Tax=Dryococelus australis TaxID=614101 RepID=A0ABQ9GEL7_9NEOP|nr:hypothetical protein PR048_027131 [Dryococelus australis]